LPVLSQHCHAIARLPRHHHDLFDRLLVAQALAMRARLLTSDDKLVQYSDLVQRITLR
jgi:PIN domain nuclease of toxin-antitoxin system